MIFRARQDLRAPGLDRADLLVRVRLQARLDADHRLQRDQSGHFVRRSAWAFHMILPWLRSRSVRGSCTRMIRANVTGAQRGLRARTAREGCAGWQVMRSHVLAQPLLPRDDAEDISIASEAPSSRECLQPPEGSATPRSESRLGRPAGHDRDRRLCDGVHHSAQPDSRPLIRGDRPSN